MTITVRIYLVRHAETDANRDNIIQGQLDVPLNEVGLEQAKLVGDALRGVAFDVAFSSDLSRAMVTAAAISKHQANLEVRKREGLREREFMGELQGQGVRRVRSSGVGSTIEAGPVFIERVMAWWKEDIVTYTASLPSQEKPYNILAVSHGGFIGTLVRNLIQSGTLHVEKGTAVVACPNTSVSIIEWTGQRGRLVQYGDASHLSNGPLLDQNADEVRV